MDAELPLNWGPERPTFEMENPADHIAFNSIIDNPSVGDERDFLVARRIGLGKNGWRNRLEVDSESEYEARLYVHNNGAANLDLIAHDVRVSVSLPFGVSDRTEVVAEVSWTDANRRHHVWDNFWAYAERPFRLSLADEPVIYHSNGKSEGSALDPALFSPAGALVGYDRLDGTLKGCLEYSGYLTFRFSAVFSA